MESQNIRLIPNLHDLGIKTPVGGAGSAAVAVREANGELLHCWRG